MNTADITPEVTIAAFVDHTKEALQLEILAGASELSARAVLSTRIQKPGLALAGFLDFVHPERVQILGETEIAYLGTLSEERQRTALSDLIRLRPCCFLITKGLEPPAALLELAKQANCPLLRSPLVSSEVLRVTAAYLQDLLAQHNSLHGVLVDVDGVGVLITGPSGIGKSECALDLVSRGHRLVADDIVKVRRRGDDLVGEASGLIRELLEIRGLGILNIAELYGVAATRVRKRIELHVELRDWAEVDSLDRSGLENRQYELLGLKIDSLLIPIRPGRNTGRIVEVAARNFLLHLRGHHAGEALNRRIREVIGQEGSSRMAEPKLNQAARIPGPAEHIEDEVE